MLTLKVGIQVESMGQRCGIYTYARRLNDALNKHGVKSHLFYRKPTEDVDVVNIQYEPGLWGNNLQMVSALIQQFPQVVITTMHHTFGLNEIGVMIDGFIIHDKIQIENMDTGWGTYAIIPHPAIYFPKKDKESIRKELGLPTDRKIVGTAGFIAGTGKRLPILVREILKRLKDDEFLYLATSFFKSDLLSTSRKEQILKEVRRLGKEDNFRLDTEFVDDETLNKKMQACDLLFAWNITPPDYTFSQSGIASDMYASYTKLIVKDANHYKFIKEQDKVEVGRPNPDEFAEDVVNLLRDDERLHDVPDGKWLSWDNQVNHYIDFFKEFI